MLSVPVQATYLPWEEKCPQKVLPGEGARETSPCTGPCMACSLTRG